MSTATRPREGRSTTANTPGVGARAWDGARRHRAAIGSVGLAAVLYSLLLADKSMWLDEGASIGFATSSWPVLWDTITGPQTNMGLYYVLLHFWMKLGQSEAFVRALSVVPAVATVGLAYVLGRRLFGRAEGTLAALLLAVNAFAVRYAQEARAYSLVMMLMALSTLLFVSAVRSPSRGRWAAYAVTSALACYAHFFAAFVILSHVLSIPLLRGARALLRPLAATYGVVALFVSPLMLYTIVGDRGQIDWIGDPTLGSVQRALTDLTGETGLVLVGAYGLLGIIALGRALRASDRWPYALLLAWFLVPVLLSFGLSLWFKPMFLSRFLIVSLPALALIGGVGLASLRFKPAVGAFTAGIVALSSIGLHGYYFDYEKEDWRGATRFVVDNALPSDGIVIYAGRLRRNVEYYVGLFGAERDAPSPIFPPGDWGTFAPGEAGRPTDGLPEARPDRYPRVWLALAYARVGPRAAATTQMIEDVLSRRYRQVVERRFKRIRLRLYESPRLAGNG